ncbi:uncharacterized protein LOC133895019 [Phragmites australis]|uniref:uncharacterized protein LOC133895019 n=1 Tax=Phragmites australis TaxID=29695 RepID=UPI002D79929E|nr:uncharacterized protein LOC133895019 [Phragmites australis]
MDSDYVTSLLMGAAASAPGLDFDTLDGGFLKMLFGNGGANLFEVRGPPEGSSVSDPMWARARDGGNARKRKASMRDGDGNDNEACLGKGGEGKGPDGKRCKVGGNESLVKLKVEEATMSGDLFLRSIAAAAS